MELKITLSIKDTILNDVKKTYDAYLFFLKMLNMCDPKIKAFYGQGKSLEEALNNKLFDIDGFVSSDAHRYISKNLPYATSLWDGNPDESMSIMFSETMKKTTVNIDLERYFGIYNMEKLKYFFMGIAGKYQLNYFSVCYSNNHGVFPERPSAGWMLYLSIIGDVSVIKNAEEIDDIYLMKNKGKLFIVKRNYDALNNSHLDASNDLEIELVDAGLLPKYKDFS